jgi:hypothetical protein
MVKAMPRERGRGVIEVNVFDAAGAHDEWSERPRGIEAPIGAEKVDGMTDICGDRRWKRHIDAHEQVNVNAYLLQLNRRGQSPSAAS